MNILWKGVVGLTETVSVVPIIDNTSLYYMYILVLKYLKKSTRKYGLLCCNINILSSLFKWTLFSISIISDSVWAREWKLRFTEQWLHCGHWVTQTYLQVIQTLVIVFGLQVKLREREDDAEVSGDGYGDGGPEVIRIQKRGGPLVPRGGEGPRTGVQSGVLWVCGGKKLNIFSFLESPNFS